MSDGSGGSVEVNLDGAHLRVDARPARLVSLLRGDGGDPVLTAQREGGASHTEAVPSAARQVTFQVDRDLTVEVTRGSDFVALSEASGRQVVVAFNGEVTVLPNGESGDRFALGAHEALLVPADGGEPRVVPSDDLSDEDQDEISAAMEAAALGATATPAAAITPGTTTTDEPTQAVPVVEEPEPTPAAASGTAKPTPPATGAVPTPGKAAGAAKKGPAVTPARTGGQANQKRGKKGKKGRPQASAKKSSPLVPAAGAAAAAAGAGIGAAGVAAASGSASKAAATPVKKSSTPAKKAPGKPPTKNGGHDDESYEDTPGDRRFIIGAVALAAIIAIVLAVFVLRGDDEAELATDEGAVTTTTEAEATESTEAPASTQAPSTTAAPSTSAAPVATTNAPTTTVARQTTTTAPATTTTARATSTTVAAAVKYGIEPKSCVQNANNSITYTATITNQSTVAFDYTVRVVFKDGDTSVASTDANVARLAAGRSVDFTATGTPSRNLTNGGQCSVERVDARPSGS